MWLQTISEKIDAIRGNMEKAAIDLGLGHPKVYQLSVELDKLHVQWEKERSFYKLNNNLQKEPAMTLYKQVI